MIPFENRIVKIKSIKTKDRSTEVQFSTSEKNRFFDQSKPVSRENSKYIWSNWICNFVGEAHEFALLGMKKDDTVVVSGKFSNAPYMQGAELKFPTRPQMTIFKATEYRKSNSEEVAETPAEDDIPF